MAIVVMYATKDYLKKYIRRNLISINITCVYYSILHNNLNSTYVEYMKHATGSQSSHGQLSLLLWLYTNFKIDIHF